MNNGFRIFLSFLTSDSIKIQHVTVGTMKINTACSIICLVFACTWWHGD